jgi:hypothetical protein
MRFEAGGGRTRTRTLDPLIKSPSRAVILKELFSQRVAKRRLKDQYLAVYFPNGTAPAQVQRRTVMSAFGRIADIAACLPYPQKRTLIERVGMSALCQ